MTVYLIFGWGALGGDGVGSRYYKIPAGPRSAFAGMTCFAVMPASEPASIQVAIRKVAQAKPGWNPPSPWNGLRRSDVSVEPAMTRIQDSAVRGIGAGMTYVGEGALL